MGVPGSNRYRVQVRFDLENTAFIKGMRKVNNELDNTQKQIRENYGALNDSLTRMNRNILMMLGGIAAGFTALAIPAIKMSGEFERLGVTFEVLAGSAEKAKKLIEDIKTFAIRTPLQVKDIQEAATMMLGFGYSIDEIIPKLQMFGEASAALRVPLEQIIRVREFLSAGQFRTIMLAPLGITREELERFGAIFGTRGELISGAEETVAAFDNLLTTRFQGLFDKVFGTITGRISNIIDQIQLTFAEIGDALKPIVVEVMDWLEQTFSRLRIWLEENQAMVTAAFNELLSVVKPIFTAMSEAVERFMTALEKDPDILIRLARNINNVVKALIAMLIINTVIIGIIKFSIAITFLTGLLKMLHLTWAGMGTFLISPWAIAIGLAIAGLIALQFAFKKQTEAVTEAREAYEKLREEFSVTETLFEELITTLTSVNDVTEFTQEQIDFLREKLEELNNAFPDLLEQFGYAIDAEGFLTDATGSVITELDVLQDVINQFNTQVLVDEAKRGAEALLILSQARLMEVAGPDPTGADIQARRQAGEIGFWESGVLMLMRDISTAGRALQEALYGTTTAAIESAERVNEAAWKDLIDRFVALTREGAPGITVPAGEDRGVTGGAGAGGDRFGRGGRYSATEWLAFQERKRQLDIALQKVEEALLDTRREEWKITELLSVAEAEKLEVLQTRLIADKVRASSDRERAQRERDEKDAEREAIKEAELKGEGLAEQLEESVREVYRTWREKLMEGASMLTEGILTGDISRALNYGFNLLTEHLTTRITAMLAQAQLATLGGPIGAVIGWGLSMLIPGPKGATPATPFYAFIVNFPEDRLGAYLPFSFMFSGRSNVYDVDYRGASLDRIRGGRRLGFHYNQ